MISVLVVDDERPARQRICALLEGHPDFAVVGECGNGREAVSAIREIHPDLVFLDVQMPEVDGFGVAEEIGADQMPMVVFATAYDEFALRAFDAHAIDYLLKPFDEERFQRTLNRVRAQLSGGRADMEERLRALVHEMSSQAVRMDRIPVRVGPRTRFVDLADVDYMEADDNYVRLHVGERSYLIRETMSALESRLPPSRFVRIHRSLIVNVARVQEVEPGFSGEYVVFLTCGARLTSTRTYRARIQAVLHL
ncbi:LytR/AlgR family response regulator transcription factor [Longimicrobium terrae]|uniref:Two-component system LytT family response regulator n=1 Tax=Longimicrobium terrae TaxID=1639882 RepID=A0A841H6H6_9BACT|nr:LytTR family DNA-binding domain-containing protein [Longimicrobium terrae]MBB4639513.1 two-component system LytT family response regulator [Longimicrobium terrae]MBB6073885.1 two-component system LytT family response regulator [Longimicrobium terrae]NNC32497.1 response regulator transcription factor [Longimicrobium terrae]